LETLLIYNVRCETHYWHCKSDNLISDHACRKFLDVYPGRGVSLSASPLVFHAAETLRPARLGLARLRSRRRPFSRLGFHRRRRLGLNVVTREVSWVDRLWSILPPCSAWLIVLKKLPVLPTQPGIRPDYLRDLRHSVLKDLPLDKRNPLLVTLQLLFFGLRDVVLDPVASGAKIFNGLHGSVSEAPMLGLIVASMISVWGIRLSYNFWRKGGYWLGGEDYRWVRVRQWFGMSSQENGEPCCFFGESVVGRAFGAWIIFPLFNITFICAFQVWLLVIGLTGPLLHRLLTNPIINSVDIALVLLFLLLIIVETVADQQQWDFHQRKKAVNITEKGKEMAKDAANYDTLSDEIVGFLRSGLFSLSRHPNFIAEMTLWWLIYLLSLSTSLLSPIPVYYNASVFGTISLTAIFLGSTPLTESLSIEKYGDFYRKYQSRVSRLLPFI